MNELEYMLISKDICKMIGKRHDNLLRNIENYISDFTYLKIELSEYFIRSSYKDGSGYWTVNLRRHKQRIIFLIFYSFDCAVLPANAFFYQKHGTLLSTGRLL